MATIIRRATIRCPKCGAEATETMPLNACQHFYACGECDHVLTPEEEHCCIFCSYSDQVCPPRQVATA